MTRSIFILLFIFSSTLIFAQPQWLKGFGDENSNYFNAMDVDPNGNIYLVGEFSDSITLNGITIYGGSYALYLAKLNAEGDMLWLKSEQSAARYDVYDLKVIGDDGFVICGTFDSDDAVFGGITLTQSDFGNTFVVKYDSNGNAIWGKTEIGYAYYEHLAIDSNGDVIITGSLVGDFTFDGSIQETFGEYDILYAKYAANGDPLWIKTMGGAGYEFSGEVTTDTENNIIMTGRFNMSFEFEGNVFNLIALGDNFVMKTDAEGTPIWVNLIGSEYDDSEIKGMAIGADGNIYLGVSVENNTYVDAITINTLGLTDACLMQLNPDNGALNWYKTGGGYEYDYVYALTVGAEGVFIGGIYSGIGEFDGLQLPDAFSGSYITSYNYDGDAMQVVSFVGTSFVSLQEIAVDQHGNLYAGGSFYDDIMFDGMETLNTVDGSVDIYLYKEASPLVAINNYSDKINFSVAPNPATTYINLSVEKETNYHFDIVNQQGAIVKSIENIVGENTMYIADLAAGMYFVVITNSDGIKTSQPFVKN